MWSLLDTPRFSLGEGLTQGDILLNSSIPEEIENANAGILQLEHPHHHQDNDDYYDFEYR